MLPPPSVGLVSKRVFHSPIVKFILPARVRSCYRHDVAFVGTHHIEVREIDAETRDSRTRHVATKDDFNSEIMNARSIVLQQLPGSMNGSFASAMSDPSDHEMPDIKTEDVEQNGLSGGNAANPSGVYFGPPQMILVTLKSKRLLLLGMRQRFDGRGWEFVVSDMPLPIAEDPMDQLGDLIAVDPQHRAFAISSFRNSLQVFRTRPVNPFSCTIQDLVAEQRDFSLHRTIQLMEFLNPPFESQDKLQLILVLGEKGRHDLIYMSFDANGSLATNFHCVITPLKPEVGFPQMLIPCLYFKGYFILASDHVLVYYLVTEDGNISETITEKTRELPSSEVPTNYIRNSRRHPSWASWAVAEAEAQRSELFWLAREDGLLCWRNFKRLPNGEFIAHKTAGEKISKSFGTAFALTTQKTKFDRFGSYVSVFLVGDLCDGGFYSVGEGKMNGIVGATVSSVMTPIQKEVFYNWAPFIDIAVVEPLRPSRSGSEPIEYLQNHSQNFGSANNDVQIPSRRNLILATTGKNESGAISEIRYGCELPVRLHSSYEDGPALDIWALPLNSSKDGVFMLSQPGCTKILHIIAPPTDVPITDEPPPDWQALSTVIGGSETITASVLPESVAQNYFHDRYCSEDIVLQVTSEAVCLVAVSTQGNSRQLLQVPIESASLAVIDSNNSTLVLVGRFRDSWTVRCRRWSISASMMSLSPIGNETSLVGDPSALIQLRASSSHVTFNHGIFALANANGYVEIFDVHPESGCSSLGTIQLGHEVSSDPSSTEVVQSLAWILCESSEDGATACGLLLCGLRSGQLHVTSLEINGNRRATTVKDTFRHNITGGPLQVTADQHDSASAFLTGPLHLSRITFFSRDPSDATINNTYWTRRDDRAWSNSQVNALCQAPITTSLGGDVVCVTQDEILSGPLQTSPQALPRKFSPEDLRVDAEPPDTVGPPNRLLYSPQYNAIFTASIVHWVVGNVRHNQSRLDAFFLPASNDSQSRADLRSAEKLAAPFWLDEGERVDAAVEWKSRINGKDMHCLLVIGTCVVDIVDSRERFWGNIRVFRLERRPRRLVQLKCSRESVPVTALATCGERSLVYGCGDDLVIRTYSEDGSKLRIATRITLMSRAACISTQGSLIFVTTANHSIQILSFDEINSTLQVVNQDVEARHGLSHLILPDFDLAIVTSKSGRLNILPIRANPTPQVTQPNYIKARLPTSILRLARANLRPDWKRRTITGVLENNIVGTATDGAMFTFSLVDKSCWRLLRFIQNMCERNAEIKPFRDLPFGHKAHLEPDDSNPEDLHVDGDVLDRVMKRRDAESLLLALLQSPPDMNVRGDVDFDSIQTRCTRFQQLVSAISSRFDPKASIHGDLSADIAFAVKYVRAVIDIPL